jgi:Flp pilus assembly protein TadG
MEFALVFGLGFLLLAGLIAFSIGSDNEKYF